MTRRSAIVALAASTLLLAGCAIAPTLPPAISQSELADFLEQRNVEWWESAFPGEPRPIVEPLGYVDSYGPSSPFTTCLLDRGVAGVRLDGGNVTFDPPPGGDVRDYVCSLRFPRRVDDPESAGILSAAQVDYLYDFLEGRLVPCLTMLGYDVGPMPARRAFGEALDPGQFAVPLWNPYAQLAQPVDWETITSRCPRPPYLAAYFLAVR
jgi:hypothetical protein